MGDGSTDLGRWLTSLKEDINLGDKPLRLKYTIMPLDNFKHIKLQKILSYIKNDPVFAISLILALLSCFFAVPKVSYIDFKVLASLFNLMVVVKAFEELRLLDMIATGIINKCTDSRRMSLVMVLLSFFSSMIVTNDISLLTLVPLTLIISKKTNINVLVTVILQTLAANIGSSLTPMGNPQNLYIFSYYKLTASQFFMPVTLFTSLGLIWLFILNYKTSKYDLSISLESIEIKDKSQTIIWVVLFGIVILSIFEIISYIAVFLLTVILTAILNKKLFKKADYFLLITFICFFIFIGNMSSIPAINEFVKLYISSRETTYFYSILLSQVISNVPCAIFLSRFTDNWRELLLGVNIGGMGTIIASLASVISYKLYTNENSGSSKSYMLKFSLYNFLSLIIFTIINYFLIK